jgi:hypothetical protein
MQTISLQIRPHHPRLCGDCEMAAGASNSGATADGHGEEVLPKPP